MELPYRPRLEIPGATMGVRPTQHRHTGPKDSPSVFASPLSMDSVHGDSASAAIKEAEDDTPLRRIFVFDTQKTSSKIFTRQLCNHLRFGVISHPFALAATVGPERISRKLRNNERAEKAMEEQVKAAPSRIGTLTYHAALYRFLKDGDRVEREGKILFVKEHPALVMSHSIITSAVQSQETLISKLQNPTCLPTELLETVIPIIFIKHPALVIPSWLRWANGDDPDRYTVDDDEVTLWTSARWARMLFDYLRTSQHMQRVPGRRRHSLASPVVSSWPFVLDDADVTDNTHATLATLCRVLGIDGDGASSWDPGMHFKRAGEKLRRSSKDNVFDAYTRRVSTISQEGGRRHSVAEPTVNIDAEQSKWKQQFGEAMAREIRRKVEEEMPHYEYLKKFKLRPQRTVTQTDFHELMSGLPRRRRSDVESPVSPTDADTPVSALRHVRSAVDLKSLQGAG